MPINMRAGKGVINIIPNKKTNIYDGGSLYLINIVYTEKIIAVVNMTFSRSIA